MISDIGDMLCTESLQHEFVLNHIFRLALALRGRANLLAEAIERIWHIRARLKDLPEQPQWWINATGFESGRNWRFSKREMGDWVIGYYANPDVSLASAVAASAAVPFLIGQLKLHLPGHRSRISGYRMPPGHENVAKLTQVGLWDGAIYDNLGVEKLFKVSDFAQPGL